jgi:hypothetical protein
MGSSKHVSLPLPLCSAPAGPAEPATLLFRRLLTQVAAASTPLQCSSCWAFASAAALESLNAIQRGQLVNVAEQDIIDCAPVTPGFPPRTECGPGMSTEAMQLSQTTGVTTDNIYGNYTARKGTCNAQAVQSAPPTDVFRIVTSPGYQDVTPRSATELLRVSRSRGPCEVAPWGAAGYALQRAQHMLSACSAHAQRMLSTCSAQPAVFCSSAVEHSISRTRRIADYLHC